MCNCLASWKVAFFISIQHLSTFRNHILICASIHFLLIGFVLTLTLDLCAFWLWICVHRPQSFGAAVMRVGWLELRWKWNKQDILTNYQIIKILNCTKRHGGWQYSKYFCVTLEVFVSRFLKNFDQNLSCWGWPSIFDSSSSWNFELHQILSNLLSMQCNVTSKSIDSPQKLSLLPNWVWGWDELSFVSKSWWGHQTQKYEEKTFKQINPNKVEKKLFLRIF